MLKNSPEYAYPLNVYGRCVVHEFIGRISSWHGVVITEFMFNSPITYSGLYHQAACHRIQQINNSKKKKPYIVSCWI